MPTDADVEESPSPRERVARGAEFLDEHRPGWRSEINLADLDLESTCGCVLGQLFGTYGDGLRALATGVPRVWGASMGFDDPRGEAHAELTELWLEELGARGR